MTYSNDPSPPSLINSLVSNLGASHLFFDTWITFTL
jgi:hypothetical protein